MRVISTTSRRELSSSFFFLQGKAQKEIQANLTETLQEHAPSYATIKNWGPEGHFEGKMPQEGQQGGLVLALQCPGSLGTCNPEETGLPGWPSRTSTCSLD